MNVNEFFTQLRHFVEDSKDGWELIETAKGNYGYNPRRILDKTLGDLFVFANYYIDWDEIFEAPVLSAYFYKSNGERLSCEELISLMIQPVALLEREHPITGTPVFFLHPCKTNDFVLPLIEHLAADYLHVWIATYGPFFFYYLPNKHPSDQYHSGVS